MVHAGGSPDALTTLKGMAHMDEIYNAGGSSGEKNFGRPPQPVHRFR